jgi:hypothetical protein
MVPAMSDNIIPFRPRKPTKPKRPTPEWQRRLLIAVVIAAALIATFLYFYLTGPSQGSI